MNLDDPERSQATTSSDGASAPVPCKFSGLVQSSSANAAFTSGETPAIGVAVSVPDPGNPTAVAKT